jgi:hypothetical protein
MTQLAGSGSAGFAAIGWFVDGGEGVARQGLADAARAFEKG